MLVKQSPEIAWERIFQILLSTSGPIFGIAAGTYLLFAGKPVVELIVRKTLQADVSN
jgi:hypothetical protein